MGTRTNLTKTSRGCYPCGNFSDTSSINLLKATRLTGHASTVWIDTEKQNQVTFYPFVLHEISVLTELNLGHLHYHLIDVPLQPISQYDIVLDTDQPANGVLIVEKKPQSSPLLNRINKNNIRVVVFHTCIAAPTYSTPPMSFHKTDESQAQQGALSQLILPSPFPWLWFR